MAFRALTSFGMVTGAMACAKGQPDAAPAAAATPSTPAAAPAASPSASASSSGSPSEASAPAPDAASSSSPSSGTPGGDGGAFALECQIAAPARIKAGQPVTVHFRLSLRSGPPVYVLNWRTPLEGLRGDDFRVVRDGVDIPYAGPMFKRGNPAAKNYLALDPSKPLEADVELSLAYDFRKAGHYRVDFKGHIWDLVTNQAEVPRPLDRHRAVPLSCAGIDVDVTP